MFENENGVLFPCDCVVRSPLNTGESAGSYCLLTLFILLFPALILSKWFLLFKNGQSYFWKVLSVVKIFWDV